MESALNYSHEVAWIMLVIIFILLILQEAVNGFHDTANAIATVIYSNSMKAMPAVVMAATCNFIGVIVGGTAVAFTIAFMLPIEMIAGINTPHEASLFLALIFTSLSWNFGTWWLGIPNSTTHTYIGSIIGISMAHAYLTGTSVMQSINWHQGDKILITLAISPLVGFTLAIIFLKAVKLFVKDKKMYQPASTDTRPPTYIRSILIAGAAAVSLLHGSNDGQKSIGLMMLVMMGLLPAVYGLNTSKLEKSEISQGIDIIIEAEQVVQTLSSHPVLGSNATVIVSESKELISLMTQEHENKKLSKKETINLRTDILSLNQSLNKISKNAQILQVISPEQFTKLENASQALKNYVEYVPFWIILTSATALGIGTAVGYKKIVTTLGEKMGSSHMSPAQGTAAQLAAVVSIGMADFGGMPVSTTHVLSSGVAGTVVASPGQKLQKNTVMAILITWITTLPGTITAAFVMGILFHAAFV